VLPNFSKFSNAPKVEKGYGALRASTEKFTGGESTEKTRPKNIAIEPPSTLLIQCLKI